MKVNESETVADKAFTLRSLFFLFASSKFHLGVGGEHHSLGCVWHHSFFFSFHRPAERFRDHSREQEETTAKSVDSTAA